MSDTGADLAEFLAQECLPEQYRQQIHSCFIPFVDRVLPSIRAGDLRILGIHGAQGSGKSTLAAFLRWYLQREHGMTVAVVSLDDFYLRRTEREMLAKTQHPLLITRGVPGSHDVGLAKQTLAALLALTSGQSLDLPRFDKACDDRAPRASWPRISGPIDLIIFEGWCMGAQACEQAALSAPVNDLEASEDSDGAWRYFVNKALAGEYQELFASIDYLLMLAAPSFDCVKAWRLEQEQKLAARVAAASALMTEADIERFIQHYERITRQCLQTLGQRADCVMTMAADRRISAVQFLKHSDDDIVSVRPSIVFTDLDGTLLDHDDYSFRAALPALARLRDLGVIWILNTSKTQAELLQLSSQLNNPYPFIIENGAAVVVPAGCNLLADVELSEINGQRVKGFAPRRSEILELLRGWRQQHGYKFSGFADFDAPKLCKATGLSLQEAELALQRDYSEPILWEDSEEHWQSFALLLRASGLQALRGGRFIHIMGGADKGQAMAWLASCLYPSEPAPQVIALGDSGNDIAMLARADIGVVVRSPHHPPPHVAAPQGELRITKGFGPAGWNEALLNIFAASN
ncbi:HAD-IIB family hydrolase [Zhongshania sp.]|uniref:HAD-IIB family hydrolase n=1 Tax=Zhongshania sp. TaxID=1971902 RepID=UPI0035623E56